MAMNPYAAHLAERDPREVIAETPGQLQQYVQRLGPKGVERAAAAGKWSVREILCHLADTEIAFAFRLRQALAEPHHTIQPFDQDAWARNYAQMDAQAALDTFTALRRWNVAFIAAAPREAFTKPLTHPERGTMTFQTLLETMAGHDVNHLRQVDALAAPGA